MGVHKVYVHRNPPGITFSSQGRKGPHVHRQGTFPKKEGGEHKFQERNNNKNREQKRKYIYKLVVDR
jgi:hypothetical protein